MRWLHLLKLFVCLKTLLASHLYVLDQRKKGEEYLTEELRLWLLPRRVPRPFFVKEKLLFKYPIDCLIENPSLNAVENHRVDEHLEAVVEANTRKNQKLC